MILIVETGETRRNTLEGVMEVHDHLGEWQYELHHCHPVVDGAGGQRGAAPVDAQRRHCADVFYWSYYCT